jgi:hypothetical protein
MESNESLQLQAILAEYSALRQEIVQRVGNRAQLLVASSTISALIIGVALERRSAELLLVAPLAACLFGFQMLSETAYLFELGNYIQEKIETPLRSTYGEFAGWEENLSSQTVWRSMVGHLPTVLSTMVPSIVALVLAWSYPGPLSIKIGLFSVDLLVMAYYLIEYWRQISRQIGLSTGVANARGVASPGP